MPPTAGLTHRGGVGVRRAHLDATDVASRHGLRVTTPLRTCFDLARHMPLVEAVASTDVALHLRTVALDDLRRYVRARSAVSGVKQAGRVLELVEPASKSPMESRPRLVLVLGGLPRPLAQVPLRDERGRFVGRPDLYYPQVHLAIEYDGGAHRERLTSDDRRQNCLQRAGIQLLRYSAPDVYERPRQIVREVRGMVETHR